MNVFRCTYCGHELQTNWPFYKSACPVCGKGEMELVAKTDEDDMTLDERHPPYGYQRVMLRQR